MQIAFGLWRIQLWLVVFATDILEIYLTIPSFFIPLFFRNSNRKFRRHINENALGIIRSTLNSGGFGPQAPNINKELGIPSNAGPMNQLAAGYQRPLSHPGGGSAVAAAAAAVTAAQMEKGMFSISQLNLEITEQHVGSNGRMEITCLSTIPATVGQGEQYADYKTYSVKGKRNNSAYAWYAYKYGYLDVYLRELVYYT